MDSNFGIMVYNNSAVSGSWIKPSLMKRITKTPNVVAIKENTPDVLSYYMMQKAIDPKGAVIFTGLGDEMFPFCAPYGCVGLVSSLSNFIPERSYSMYEAAVARDFSKVIEIRGSLAPFYKIPAIVNSIVPLSSFTAKATRNHGPGAGVTVGAVMYISVYKAAMDMMGLRGREVRSPLVGINEEEKAELGGILKAMKIL